MFTVADRQERQERILTELSELGLALARDLQTCALAADDLAAKSDLGRTFQHVARSVRQALALEARFERDRLRAERDARIDAEQARAERAERRKAQVRMAVKRCVLYEHSGFEADNLLGDLEERLEEDGLYDVFAGEDDINAHIERLCAELDVPPPGGDEDAVAAEAAEAAVLAPAERSARAERRSSG